MQNLLKWTIGGNKCSQIIGNFLKFWKFAINDTKHKQAFRKYSKFWDSQEYVFEKSPRVQNLGKLNACKILGRKIC